MGITNSRDGSWRQGSLNRSSSSSWDSYLWYNQYPYDQESPSFAPQSPSYYPHLKHEPPYYPPSEQVPQCYNLPSRHQGSDKRMLQRRYSRIADNYHSLDQVTEALVNAGLESSNLIVGIDFTKSNQWTGKRSFNGKSLHHIGNGSNPYEQAISIIGRTLAVFDEDNLIPCFGFGDASTHDHDVFSFYPDKRFCNGFEEVLSRYREIVPHLRLSGPTSFAPIIEMAMTIVEQSCGQYHVLVIIADGQVTGSDDTGHGGLSPQEQKTINAIVQASKLPLSIIVVGVGDGPWDLMKEFDDNIPARAFDNFQFVNFTEIMSKSIAPTRKEMEFALAALMEIPSQYKATIEHNILGVRKGNVPERVPLPPRTYGPAFFNSLKPSHSTRYQYGPTSFSSPIPSHLTSFRPSIPLYPGDATPVVSSTPQAPTSTNDCQLCPICLSNSRDMAFGCGHQSLKPARYAGLRSSQNSNFTFNHSFDKMQIVHSFRGTGELKLYKEASMAEEENQVVYDDDKDGDFEDENSIPNSQTKNKTNKKRRKLLKEAAEADNRGVCYLSRVPPHMDHVKLRQLLSQYGEILRIYLAPSGRQPQVKGKRPRPSKVQEQEFSEGWVEFARKGIAKRVANMLNGEQIGGKKRSSFYYDLWNIKYLSKFKWDDLTEEIAYKSAIREQKLALELSAAKRERDFYLSKVDQSRALNAIEERMKKKQKVQEEAGMNSELLITQKKTFRQFRQRKPIAVDSSQGKPRLSKDLLAGVFAGS
ncbi:hypothetical protein V6N11_023156 [Hibiscus sabdariffa]|uniref:VWFA domain-containing protein n=1 Tax=Hibiscus sabdariffa TaxID=183260 RepID=A0ABR2TLE3_9ROSI